MMPAVSELTTGVSLKQGLGLMDISRGRPGRRPRDERSSLPDYYFIIDKINPSSPGTTTSKAFQFFGLGFGLSEGGPLPSGVGGASSKAPACGCSRPHHCGPFTAAQVVLDLSDLPTFSPSLSSPPRQ